MAEPTDDVRGLLKAELARRGIDYAELARLLDLHGLTYTEAEVTEQIERAPLTGPFVTQCFEAMGAPVVHLDF
ncbi:MAG TPA: DUF6471 domain-containing protein [Phenylobacterium sp.]|jgi:hypothetical protein|uniref:DUF6471 domain-containing protein n=1 Tax=Phenylobacterium conjunctum TaxID=1298959 RepID=A0ABW3T2K4_9CAUL|nr:DUF6471 domain-containing protein [Phenylobacterium sp.]HQP19837.1 DUF6471 domain-containing protein [Phenylobacterium sp.]